MKNVIVGKRGFGWNERKRIDLENKIRCLESTFEKCGHIHLETIYEVLGITLNKSNKNVCYMKENGPINFEYELMFPNRYKITISQ